MVAGFYAADGGRLLETHSLAIVSGDTDRVPSSGEVPRPLAAPGEWPLFCHEACNLLVAKAREVVKRRIELHDHSRPHCRHHGRAAHPKTARSSLRTTVLWRW